MKRQILKIASVVFFSVLLVACNYSNDLTEEDVLKYDQQDVPYSLRIFDALQTAPVENAKVTVTIDGQPTELQTDANGVVNFSTKQKDLLIVDISKDGYFSRQTKVDVTSLIKPRGDLHYEIALYPSGGTGMFTVTGNVKVQSDLTTDAYEIALGATFEAIFQIYNYSTDEYEIVAKVAIETDETGRYKIMLPAVIYNGNNWTDGYLMFNYLGYSTKQKLAINRLDGQDAFPKTLPSIQQIDTQFDPTNSSGLVSIPSVTNSVYATIPAPPAGANALQANPFFPALDGAGGLSLSTTGITPNGNGYASGDIPLTITSLTGGAGAVGVIRDTNADGTLDQYQFTTAGTGYALTNANINKVGTQGFSALYFSQGGKYYTGSGYWKAGQIIINDINYGTGSSRLTTVQ